MNWFDRWWNGSDSIGWFTPIIILVCLAIPVGVIWVIVHFVTKYW